MDEVGDTEGGLARARAALARTGHAPRPRRRADDAAAELRAVPAEPTPPPDAEARIAELEGEVARLRAALARIQDDSRNALGDDTGPVH